VKLTSVIRIALTLLIAGAFASTLLLTRSASQETEWNREVLCIGIITNEANTARNDPRLLELCDRVGIRP
jgi:hypothetical protein